MTAALSPNRKPDARGASGTAAFQFGQVAAAAFAQRCLRTVSVAPAAQLLGVPHHWRVLAVGDKAVHHLEVLHIGFVRGRNRLARYKRHPKALDVVLGYVHQPLQRPPFHPATFSDTKYGFFTQVFLVLGIHLVQWIPLPVLGGFVVAIGLELMVEWIW